MTATDHDCPDADYWRAEALTARGTREVLRAELARSITGTAALRDAINAHSCTVEAPDGEAPDDEAGVWRDAAVLARDALAPVAAGILPRPLATGLLAYDEAPEPPRGAELLMSLAVAGPWIACSTGWALVVAASSAAAAVARWVRS